MLNFIIVIVIVRRRQVVRFGFNPYFLLIVPMAIFGIFKNVS